MRFKKRRNWNEPSACLAQSGNILAQFGDRGASDRWQALTKRADSMVLALCSTTTIPTGLDRSHWDTKIVVCIGSMNIIVDLRTLLWSLGCYLWFEGFVAQTMARVTTLPDLDFLHPSSTEYLSTKQIHHLSKQPMVCHSMYKYSFLSVCITAKAPNLQGFMPQEDT